MGRAHVLDQSVLEERGSDAGHARELLHGEQAEVLAPHATHLRLESAVSKVGLRDANGGLAVLTPHGHEGALLAEEVCDKAMHPGIGRRGQVLQLRLVVRSLLRSFGAASLIAAGRRWQGRGRMMCARAAGGGLRCHRTARLHHQGGVAPLGGLMLLRHGGTCCVCRTRVPGQVRFGST